MAPLAKELAWLKELAQHKSNVFGFYGGFPSTITWNVLLTLEWMIRIG